MFAKTSVLIWRDRAIAVFLPIRLYQEREYESLAMALQAFGFEASVKDSTNFPNWEQCFAIMQGILDLHPKAYSACLGREVGEISSDLPLLINLFEQEIPELNQFRPCPNEPCPYGDNTPDWVKEFKFKSSGDYYADYMADLARELGSFEQAEQAAKHFSRSEVDHFLWRSREINRSIEDLAEEEILRYRYEEMDSPEDRDFIQGLLLSTKAEI